MRFDANVRDGDVATPSRAPREDRENVAPNGDTPLDATLPVIVAPLLAMNDTDAPPICELVTVTTCVPAVGDSVHLFVDLPSLSVVVVGCDTVPPPVTVQESWT